MYADAGENSKRHAPAVARNREAIAEVLQGLLPKSGTVLEIASGTGEHALYFAEKFPHLVWQPSDPDPSALASIEAWRGDAATANLLPAVDLDTQSKAWPIEQADAIFCANMIHIAPWEATDGLFAGAARVLSAGASLILYGPYLEEKVTPAPSNLDFDESLKLRNPAWGIRRREEVDALANEYGFALKERHEMPANNLTLIYRKV